MTKLSDPYFENTPWPNAKDEEELPDSADPEGENIILPDEDEEDDEENDDEDDLDDDDFDDLDEDEDED